jgi:hypothetical protein
MVSDTTPSMTEARRARVREHGRFLTSFILFLALVGGTLAVIAFVFGTIVPVGAVGVRKIAFGPGQGLRHRSLPPGLPPPWYTLLRRSCPSPQRSFKMALPTV